MCLNQVTSNLTNPFSESFINPISVNILINSFITPQKFVLNKPFHFNKNKAPMEMYFFKN
jgi:hypothetical protein